MTANHHYPFVRTVATSIINQAPAGEMVNMWQQLMHLQQQQYAYARQAFGREQFRILTWEMGFTREQAQSILAPMVKHAVAGARWAYRAKAAGLTAVQVENLLNTALRLPNPSWYIKNVLIQKGAGLPFGLDRWYELSGYLRCALEALKIGLPGYDDGYMPFLDGHHHH